MIRLGTEGEVVMRCPKCEYEDVSWAWHAATPDDEEPPYANWPAYEHFAHQCRRCHYVWTRPVPEERRDKSPLDPGGLGEK